MLKIVFFLMSFGVLATHAQDTLKLEPSIHYSSVEYPNTHHIDFIMRHESAREDIIYNDIERRVDFCFYYDEERRCRGSYYRMVDSSSFYVARNRQDSTGQLWHYRKTGDDCYIVQKKDGDYVQTGYAKTVIPFEKEGVFRTQYVPTQEVLWASNYEGVFNQPFRVPIYSFIDAPINGTIIETQDFPILENGDTLKSLALARADYCYGEPMMALRNVTFMVTPSGELKNIRQYEGSFDDWCPHYVRSLNKLLLDMGKFKPLLKDGEPVNTRYYLDVDMLDERSNKFAKHPAFDKE